MPSSAKRMSKRLSQTPRLSIVMAGEDGQDTRKHDSVREFFANHMKTIVTLVMIFGTIACIVLIVMVHKWRFESNRAEEIQACLDVAVVGAGISGSYATWRMRHDTLSKIHLFEVSGRVGGRLYTRHFPEYQAQDQGLKAELGALYYLPQRQPLLNRTIHALNLTPREFSRPSQDLPTYYFRGPHRTRKELKTLNQHPPALYNLHHMERDKTPDELKRYYTERHLDSLIHTDPLKVKYKDNVNLYEMGYWNFLNDVSSREGFNYVHDGVPWRSHVTNGNAALLASLDLDTWDTPYTLAEGMDALPRKMTQQFENSSKNHVVHHNRRLTCIHKEDGFYKLVLQKTITEDGRTKHLPENEVVCARQIILAISPSALKHVKFTGFGEEEEDEDDEESRKKSFDASVLVQQFLDPIPTMTAYFMYNTSWWYGLRPPHEDVVTDLPVRRVRYIGSGKKKGSTNSSDRAGPDGHLFMVANPDMHDVEYFESLIKSFKYNQIIRSDCNLTMQSLNDLNQQIGKLQEQDIAKIPKPVDVVMQDWREEPFGAGWHMWKKGVHWGNAAKCLRKPLAEERIYFIGSDLCPGSCQVWIEGALQTVEDLFQSFNSSKIFEKALTSPLQQNEIMLDSGEGDSSVSYHYHPNL